MKRNWNQQQLECMQPGGHACPAASLPFDFPQIYFFNTQTQLFTLQGVEGPSSVYVNVICDRKRAPGDPVSQFFLIVNLTDLS